MYDSYNRAGKKYELGGTNKCNILFEYIILNCQAFG